MVITLSSRAGTFGYRHGIHSSKKALRGPSWSPVSLLEPARASSSDRVVRASGSPGAGELGARGTPKPLLPSVKPLGICALRFGPSGKRWSQYAGVHSRGRYFLLFDFRLAVAMRLGRCFADTDLMISWWLQSGSSGDLAL